MFDLGIAKKSTPKETVGERDLEEALNLSPFTFRLSPFLSPFGQKEL
jgi:hypothetical protein